MKPKPFSPLNHLTVPVVIGAYLPSCPSSDRIGPSAGGVVPQRELPEAFLTNENPRFGSVAAGVPDEAAGGRVGCTVGPWTKWPVSATSAWPNVATSSFPACGESPWVSWPNGPPPRPPTLQTPRR